MRMLDVRAHTRKNAETSSWTVFVQASFIWEHLLYLRTDTKNNRMQTSIKSRACHNRLQRQGSFNFSLTICGVMHDECRLQASFVVEITQCILYCCLDLFVFSHWFFTAQFIKRRPTYLSLHVTCSGSIGWCSFSQRLCVLHTVPDHGAELVNCSCETFSSLY